MAQDLTGRLKGIVPLPAKHAVRRALRRPPENARRYLRAGLSVDDFLGGLTRAGVRYAVLRWFETLPEVEPGNDIDMLVADEDLAVTEGFLTPYRPFREAQKIDLYTAGGLPRTRFGGAPYFSPALAARVLEDTALVHGRYRVPAPAAHFDSLAFHAVHHKGAASGLPEFADGPPPAGRIPDALRRLARDLDRRVELTLHGLERYLAANGLAPDAEAAERYAAERIRLYGSR